MVCGEKMKRNIVVKETFPYQCYVCGNTRTVPFTPSEGKILVCEYCVLYLVANPRGHSSDGRKITLEDWKEELTARQGKDTVGSEN